LVYEKRIAALVMIRIEGGKMAQVKVKVGGAYAADGEAGGAMSRDGRRSRRVATGHADSYERTLVQIACGERSSHINSD